MGKIILDTSRFPLVVSRFPPTWDEVELGNYFMAFRAIHALEQPFVHVSDISQAENMSQAGMRKRAAEFIADERARSARLCKGAVQIATSGLLRGAITAIQWMSPPPYPHAVVATWGEAMVWVEARARATGLVLPSAPLTAEQVGASSTGRS